MHILLSEPLLDRKSGIEAGAGAGAGAGAHLEDCYKSMAFPTKLHDFSSSTLILGVYCDNSIHTPFAVFLLRPDCRFVSIILLL